MYINRIFPVDLSYGSITTPMYSTRISTSASGWESRNARWESPRNKFDAAMLVKKQTDLDELNDFFNIVRGQWLPFRFKNWGDYKSCKVTETIAFDDQILTTNAGVGDDTFVITKTYTNGTDSTIRYITQPDLTSVLVGIDTGGGLAQTFDFSMVDGKIVLDTPLLGGETVSCGYLYYLAMRFAIDELNINLDAYLIGSASVPLMEDRIKIT